MAILQRCWQCTLALFALAAGTCAAAESTNHLKVEAIQHWHELEARGSRLEGSFRLIVKEPNSDERLATEGRFLIDRPKGWVLFRDQPPAGSKQVPVVAKVFGKSLNYVFGLRSPSGGKSYVLNYFHEPNPQDDEKISEYLAIYGGCPWSFDTRRLSDLETDPKFQLHEMRPLETDSKVVRMQASFSDVRFKGTENEMPQTVQITVYLDRSRGWVVRSYESTFKRWPPSGAYTMVCKGTIDYSDRAPEGVPIPLKHTMVFCKPDGSELVTSRTEFPNWVYRDEIKPDETGLAAFGLPEPVAGDSQQTRAPRTYLWLIAMAGLCAILAAVLHRLARRKRSVSATA